MQQHWNERYSTDLYIFGKDPNKFFRDELDKLNPGRILLVGEGEGRNGVYAATKGWQVDAVDFSEIAKQKALTLAEEYKVTINYNISDIAEYKAAPETYDAIGIIYVHLDKDVRERIHRDLINSLKPGGTIIIEVYEKDQINMSSGGPKDLELLYSLEEIVEDFADLDFITLSKENVYLYESIRHHGDAWVIRFVGRRI